MAVAHRRTTTVNKSFYFGFEDPNTSGNTLPSVTPNGWNGIYDPVNGDNRYDAGLNNTYDFPGGTHGSLESNTFSLKGYAAEDLPTLYFNYYLATESSSDTLVDGNNHMEDSMRVFVAGDDGIWHLLATNNSARITVLPTDNRDEYDFGSLAQCNPLTGLPGATGYFMTGSCPDDDYDWGSGVQQLFDVGDNGAPNTWRQARVSLTPFAGEENLRLRFDFATAGEMNVGDIRTVGNELRVVAGNRFRDGDRFTIDGVTFEFDLDVVLVAPTGRTIEQQIAAFGTAGFQVTDQVQPTPNVRTFRFVTIGTGDPLEIVFNPQDSAATIGQAIANAVNGAATGGLLGNATNPLTAYVSSQDNYRINLDGSASATVVNLPGLIETNARTGLDSADGVVTTPAPAVPVQINFAMSDIQVREVLVTQMLTYDNGSGFRSPMYVDQVANPPGTGPVWDRDVLIKRENEIIRIIDHSIVVTGLGSPLGLTRAETLAGGLNNGLQGDQFGAFFDSITGAQATRGQNNRFEGVYLDDIIIGFAERGELVFNAAPDNTGFANDPSTGNNLLPGESGSGPYQLEIRRSAEYGISSGGLELRQQFVPPQNQPRAYNTNDRLAEQITFLAPRGSEISDGQSFVISDGVDTLTFEYDDDSLDGVLGNGLGNGVDAGNVAVLFTPQDLDYEVATSLRDAVNSSQSQAVLEILASLGDGTVIDGGISSTDNRVNLYGTVVADLHGGTNFGEIDQNAAFPTAVASSRVAPGVADAIQFGVDGGNGFVLRGRLDSRLDNGDQNRFRDQGQMLIQSNIIRDVQQFGILVDAGARDRTGLVPLSGTQASHPGPVRVTRNVNIERLTPGVVVSNNVIDGSGSAGIVFSGDPNLTNQQAPSVSFGRIINNTIYGTGAGTGIVVNQQVSPTILNNIISNTISGITVDASSSTTEISHNLYRNVANGKLGTNVENLDLAGVNPALFVNPVADNFYLVSGSRAIDNSLNQLDDRFDFFQQIKNPLGIPASPILAPDLDVFGQLREDDTTSDPTGQGSKVFKDRGAIDRADDIGPIAQLLNPLDNDSEHRDVDPSDTYVQLLEATLSHFAILIKDQDGTGPDPQTITNLSVSLTEDGVGLVEGVDYTFGFNATNNTIRLTPQTGIWKPGSAYEITLNNRDRFVIVATNGVGVGDGDQFSIVDVNGSETFFEYESGYTIAVPETYSIQLPTQGALPGGVFDGVRFTVNDGTNTVGFEFDSNNNVSGSNVRIPFTNADDQFVLSTAVVAAINSVAGTTNDVGLSPRDLGGGVIHLGSRAVHAVSVSDPILTLSGQAAGIDDGEFFTIQYNNDQFITYEFENDAADGVLGNGVGDGVSGGNQPILFSFFQTHEEIAAEIVDVIVLRNQSLTDLALALDPVHLGDGRVHVVGAEGYVVDTQRSPLTYQRMAGEPGSLILSAVAGAQLADGQQFVIRRGADAPVTFEFDNNFVTTRNTIAVPFLASQTVDEVASTLVNVIRGASGLGLFPLYLNNGTIDLGGVMSHAIDVSTSNLSETGLPGVTDSLTILVPTGGGSPTLGGVQDGATFTIQRGSGPVVTFEFNNDGNTTPGNQIINFSDGLGAQPVSTSDDIARSLVSVIRGASLGLIPETFTGSGVVRLNETSEYRLVLDPNAANPAVTNLARAGVPGGAVPVVFTPDAAFTAADMAAVIVNAVNFSDSAAAAGIRSGGSIFISNATSVAGISTISSAGNVAGRLDGIKDIAGNNLQPNRPNNETQFTILLAGVELDYGDAPSPLPDQYATTRDDNGARHVIIPGAAFLGSRVDSDTNGQPTAAATGDDADISLNLGNLPLLFTALPPFNLQVPAGGEAAIADNATFTLGTLPGLGPVVFEFDNDGSGKTVATNFLIDLSASGIANQNAVADAIVSAIRLALNSVQGPHDLPILLGFEPANLGAGIVYLGGVARLTVDPATSGLTLNVTSNPESTEFRTQLQLASRLQIQVPATPNTAIVDHERFSVSDGIQTVLFEFLKPGSTATGSGPVIQLAGGDTQAGVVALLTTALGTAFPTLTLNNLGGGLLGLGGVSTLHRIDTASSSLTNTVAVTDGTTFTIDDGSHVRVVFEFDNNDATTGGHVAVPYRSTDSADQIVTSMVIAIQRQVAAVKLSGLSPRNLGNGLLHVADRTRTDIALGATALSLTNQLPGSITTVGAGLAVQIPGAYRLTAPIGVIVDGDRFTISDGVNLPVTFEFERDTALNGVDGLNRTITIVTSGTPDTQSSINAKIVAAINNAVQVDGDLVGVNASVVGGAVEITGSADLAMSTGYFNSSSVLVPGNVQLASFVSDEEQFSIGDGGATVTFEFDSGGGLTGAFEAVQFVSGNRTGLLNSTPNEVAAVVVRAIQSSSLSGIAPQVLGKGIVQLGENSTSHSITLAGGSLLQLAAGGVAGGVRDGQTFVLNDGVRVFTFEIDRNESWNPNNIRVDVGNLLDNLHVSSNATDIAKAIVGAINGTPDAQVLAQVTGPSTITLSNDDEDGVTFLDPINSNVVTTLSVVASGVGLLDAWVDFNRDGDWDDFGERIFSESVALRPGLNTLEFTAPASAFPGDTYARFRISQSGNLFPRGVTIGGEVEDYLVTIVAGTPPTAASGSHQTNEDTVLNVNILANDTDAEDDAMTVYSVNGDPLNVNRPIQLRTPSGGQLVDTGNFTVALDGTLTYDPTASAYLNALAGPRGSTPAQQHVESFVYQSQDHPACNPPFSAPCASMISSNTATETITVVGINDAPVLNTTVTVTLNTILEDANPTTNPGSSNPGTSVRAILASGGGSLLTDVDNGSVEGIAIVGPTTSPNGQWQYSTDGGTMWNNITSPSDTNARLLSDALLVNGTPKNWVRFLPNVDYNSVIAADISSYPTLAFRGWDQDSGVDGGIANTLPNGGSTAFSTAVSTTTLTITAVNDAPLILGTPLSNFGPLPEANTPALGVYSYTAAQLFSSSPPAQVGPATATDELLRQTLAFRVTTDNDALFSSLPVINGSGTLNFSLAVDKSGTAIVTVYALDGVAGGANTLESAPQTFTITVSPENDPPTVSVPGTFTINEDSTGVGQATARTHGIPGTTVGDIDVLPGVEQLLVTIEIIDGTGTTLADSSDGTLGIISTGVTLVSQTGPALQIQGTLNQLNAALATLTYTLPALNFNSFNHGDDVHVKVTVNDRGNVGPLSIGTEPPLSATNTFAIQVAPVNDAPTIDLSGITNRTIVETFDASARTRLSLPGAVFNDIDIDGGESNDNVTVTVWVTVPSARVPGVLFVDTSGAGGGVPTGSISGDGTAMIVLNGTMSAVRTTMATLKYEVADDDLNDGNGGPVTLHVRLNDNMNFGSGVAESDEESLTIFRNPGQRCAQLYEGLEPGDLGRRRSDYGQQLGDRHLAGTCGSHGRNRPDVYVRGPT